MKNRNKIQQPSVWLSWILFIICIGATVFRVVLSNWAGMRYVSSQIYDDAMLVQYADFDTYYQNALGMRFSLLKEMSFPLFLNFVDWTNLTVMTVMALLWIITALVTVWTFRVVLGKGHRISLMWIYLFVLYTPCALDAWLGVRFYRNILLAPCYLLVFDLLLASVFNALDSRKRTVLYALVIGVGEGLVLLFTYYIKEDGIWLLACTCFVLLIDALIYVIQVLRKKRKLPFAVLSMTSLLLILVIFFAGNTSYKELNRAYFGVYVTNARTSGEMGRFLKNLYQIDARRKSPSVWASDDSLDQAYAASPTLASDPVLKKEIYGSAHLEGGIRQTQINGDFFGWLYKDAFVDAGHYPDYESIQTFLSQVNDELEQAFRDGTLKKDRKRIQLVGSMGGRTPAEIVDLIRELPLCYRIHIGLEGYETGSHLQTEVTMPETVELAEDYANYDFTPTDVELVVENAQIHRADQVSIYLFMLYKRLQWILAVAAGITAIVVFLVETIRFFRRKKTDTTSFAMAAGTLIFFGFSLAYNVAIIWFNGGLDSEIDAFVATKFYSVGMVPLLMLFELLGTCLLVRCIQKRIGILSMK